MHTRTIRREAAGIMILLLAMAIPQAGRTAGGEADVSERARALARDALLVDTHIDVPYRLQEHWEDVTHATAKGDFDFPRARAGGLDVAFMSIYTPAELEAKGGATQLAHQLIDGVEALAARMPDRFALVRSTADVERLSGTNRVLLALGMENGSPIAGSLDNLSQFHARGVRYITLAHSLSNHISDSSYDKNRPWNGLSPFGIEVVARMNQLGMMIDVSHLSDDATRAVLAHSRAPVIASHSSVRSFTPGWERNLSDELIKAIAAGGGVVQVNFGSSFITSEAHEWSQSRNKARSDFLEAGGHAPGGAESTRFDLEYAQTHPFPHASVADVAEHFDHIVKLAGVDHVGIGSDFDGVGDSLPNGLKSVADYPNLVSELMRRGYSEGQLRAILGGNLMRVWREVERISAQPLHRSNDKDS